jgi:hypothetical protein
MPIDMKNLARRGAQARLAELVAEMDAILGAFPDLGKAPARPAEARKARKVSAETKAKMRAAWARRKAAAAGDTTETQTGAAGVGPKKKRVMSAQARKRISAAQKKRWASRKTGKKR